MFQNGTWWLLCQLLRQVCPSCYFLALLGTSFHFTGFYPVHRINKCVLYIAADFVPPCSGPHHGPH